MNATIDGVEVFLKSSPGFTYSFYDFVDVSKIKGNRSTTIEITATNAARAVLGGQNPAERTNGRHILRIGTGGVTYWESEVKVDEWKEDSIVCSAIGGNASWMEDANRLRLRSLNLGQSPLIDADLQRASWVDENTTLHFPLIDYGPLEQRAATYDVAVGILRPAARVWRVLTQGFNDIGYSLRAEGSFASWWKKLILPNVKDDIYGDADTRARATAIVEKLGAPITATTTGSSILNVTPSLPTVLSDPLSAYNAGTSVYTPPLFMALRPVVRIAAETTPAPNGVFPSLRIEVRRNGGNVIASSTFLPPTSTQGGVTVYDLTDFELPALNEGTQQYFVNIVIQSGFQAGQTLTVTQLQVRWEPVQVFYQAGITIDNNTTVPDWTLAELVKNVSAVLNLKFITDDITGEVVVRHYDDILKPASQGIDWRGREGWPVSKMSAKAPVRYLFRYSEDNKDADLRDVNEVLPPPGWGNATIELGGTDREISVDTAFAPTAMGITINGLYGPIMRNIDAAFQEQKLDYVPRLLIADGVTPGQWVHDGDQLEQQPKTFFVFPGDTRLGLDFGTNGWTGTTIAGTTVRYYGEQLRRITESFVVKMPVRLYDDELLNIDLTRPVYLDAGWGAAWYYVLKVDQKQFGTNGFTMVELMQL